MRKLVQYVLATLAVVGIVLVSLAIRLGFYILIIAGVVVGVYYVLKYAGVIGG